MSSTSYSFLDFTDLENSMRGQSTLGGFDVLVSYSETELNNLLKAAAALDNDPSITVPEFQVPITPAWPSTAKDIYAVDVVLSNPGFQFSTSSTSPVTYLTFSLDGSTVKLQNADGTWPDTASPIPTGLLLTVTSVLSTVTGSVDPNNPNSRFVPSSSPSDTTNGDNAIVFDPQAEQTSAVVIYLPPTTGSGPGSSVSITDPANSTDQGTLSFMTSVFETGLQAYFGSVSWYYYLHQVTNTSTGATTNASEVYDLKPTGFVFSVSAGSTNLEVDNALCTWITVQGGSGQVSLTPGSVPPVDFSVNNNPCMPIPIGQGSTASIIFAHDLVEGFFSNALSSSGCTAVVSNEAANQAGMELNFNFPSNAISKAGVDSTTTDWGTTTTNKVDAINFDIDQYTATMKIAPGLAVQGSPVGSISWASPTFRLNWTHDEDTYVAGPEGGAWSDDDHSGITDVTFSFTGTGQWVQSDQDLLDFSWTLPSSFNVNVQAEQQDLSWWQKIFSDWDGSVPADYQNLDFNLPSLSLQNSQINYFLATNLLLPGANVFLPDPILAGAASDNKGLAIPYDVLITGSLNANAASNVFAESSSLFAKRSKSLNESWQGLHRNTGTNHIANGARGAVRKDRLSHLNGTDGIIHPVKAQNGARTHNDPIRVNGNAAIGSAARTQRAAQASQKISTLPTRNLATQKSKTATDFIQEIVTCDPDSIVGPLLSAASSGSKASEKAFYLLQQHGYGDLEPDDLLSALGTSTDEILAQLDSPKSLSLFRKRANKASRQMLNVSLAKGASKDRDGSARKGKGARASKTTFDIRIFGFRYTITDGPASLTSQNMDVNPASGTITLDGETVVPTSTTDTSVQPPLTRVTWTTSAGKYSNVVFKSMPNDDGVFIASFTGSFTAQGGTAVSFAGQQYIKQSEDAIPDEPVKIIDIIAFAFGFLGPISFVISIFWRRKDQANQKVIEEAAKVSDAQTKDMSQRMEKLDKFYQDKADTAAENFAKDQGIAWDENKNEISDNTTALLDQRVRQMDLPTLKAMQQDPNNAEWQSLLQEGTKGIHETVQNIALSAGTAAIVTNLEEWISAGYLDEKRARDICKKALEPKITSVANRLTEGPPNGTGYLESAAVASIAKQQGALEDAIVATWTKNAATYGLEASKTQGEQTKKQELKEQIDQQIADGENLTPEQIETLEQQSKDLETQIGDLQDKYDREMRDAQEAQGERDRVTIDRDTDNRRAEEKGREADVSLSGGLREIE